MGILISRLPPAVNIQPADKLVVEQAGGTRQISAQDLAAIMYPMAAITGLSNTTLPTEGPALVGYGSNISYPPATVGGELNSLSSGLTSVQSQANATDTNLAAVSAQSASSSAAIAVLNGSGGSANVGHISSSSGALSTNVQKKLDRVLDAVLDFQCDNTGATNTTSKLLAFYNACITLGVKGYIPPGTYKVTRGGLRFYNNGTAMAWPIIETAGTYLVIFTVDGATNVNAPVLEWTSVNNNGDHGSSWPGNAYWYNGYHGGLTINDNTGQTGVGKNGINLTATWALEFGYVIANNMPGSTVGCPPNTINGFNPDPFATSFTRFAGIEGNANTGFVLNNVNGDGMDSWRVDIVRGVGCLSGGVYGIGQGCELLQFSLANCLGAAFDDGTAAGIISGNRNTIRVCEIDNCQYGIRLNKADNSTFEKIRFNHRFQFANNTSPIYWPLKCIDLTAGSSPNVHSVRFIDVINRIEGGGTLGALGQFLDTHSSGNYVNVEIDADYADNGPIGVTDDWLLANAGFNWTSDPFVLKKNGRALYDSRDKAISCAYGSPSTTVPNNGYGTSAAKIAFPNETAQTYSVPYNTSTSVFTAARESLYEINVAIPLQCAVGTRIRIGVLSSISGVNLSDTMYQVNTGTQTHKMSGYVKLLRNETIYVIADQNTASATIAVTINTNNSECRFSITEV